jgi:hypothetical protein
LKSIKVDEGKCKDEIGIFCFTTKALGAIFTIGAAILGVRIVP